MRLGLGIDTGNTYTDSVLVDLERRNLLTTAKAPTTRHELLLGILSSVDRVMSGVNPEDVALVAASTTLATNAIVEGKGSPIALVLLGWTDNRYRTLPSSHPICIDGRMSARGEEQVPLDEATLRRSLHNLPPEIEGVAISGFFSVRNPAHEQRAKRITSQETDLPVVCGHELTGQLGMYERTVTAALNARITPLVSNFLSQVRVGIERLGISAPLMIMRSDGSLVPEQHAMAFPIQTILSGPAASAVGGARLSGEMDATIVDIGGTTSDVVSIKHGLPSLDDEGATVGRWRTRVRAINAWVIGLGGDSHVQLTTDVDGPSMVISPRRVVPIAFGDTKIDLTETCADVRSVEWLHRVGDLPSHGISEQGRKLAELIPHNEGINLSNLHRLARSNRLYMVPDLLVELENRGVVTRIGFTPTDALHVLGDYVDGSVELSRKAAHLLGGKLGLSETGFAELVIERFRARLTDEILKKHVAKDLPNLDYDRDPLWHYLRQPRDRDLAIDISLRHPLIGLGAPVDAYLPTVASSLGTRYVDIPRAGVGSAVGAISGDVTSCVECLVRKQNNDRFLVFLPEKRVLLQKTCEQEAMAFAYEEAAEKARGMVESLGGEQVYVETRKRTYRLGIGRVRVMGIGRPIARPPDAVMTEQVRRI